MNPELMHHLRSLTRFVYYVCEEEDRFLLQLRDKLARFEERVFVYNAAFGLQQLTRVIRAWESREHPEGEEMGIHDALLKIHRDDPRDETNFYIITDPERWLSDAHVQRRVINLAHQLHNNERVAKVILFVGPRLYIPPKLQRYIEVVHDLGLNEKEIDTLVQDLSHKLSTKAHKGMNKLFRGLTGTRTKKDKVSPQRIDPKIIGEFKRRQLGKTDLLSYVDVTHEGFDQVGGLKSFKAWAEKNKACWTEEGQKFGLFPPKGVLCVGVWGCGKSLSVKAMGHAWRLPVVQLEMGRLRSSGVGESESNVYRATNLIEAVSPCVVWIDEAEKSLAGNQSSALSDAGTTARTIGILSNWLQETDAPVCLAMTANSLTTLPVEFINRMDERFFFTLPSEDERMEILKIHLAKRGQDSRAFQLAKLAAAAKQMVGREIEQAIGAAMVESFEAGHDALDHEVLLHEVSTKPRIFKTMVDEMQEIIDWVGWDPDIGDGIRAKFASPERDETFKQFKVVGDK
jgi:hypothetical protein